MRSEPWPRWTSGRARYWRGPRRWRASSRSVGTGRFANCDPPRRPRMDSWNTDSDRRRVECAFVGAAEVRAGDRVRLRPAGRADIFDLALAGKAATVEAVEQDYEGQVYVTVTVD